MFGLAYDAILVRFDVSGEFSLLWVGFPGFYWICDFDLVFCMLSSGIVDFSISGLWFWQVWHFGFESGCLGCVRWVLVEFDVLVNFLVWWTFGNLEILVFGLNLRMFRVGFGILV